MASPSRNPGFNLLAVHDSPFWGPCPAVPLDNPLNFVLTKSLPED